ncbi:hypothetical protein D9613_004322 [Agrocybe pediades]|uniref:Late embryogenesis abundant protein LEA-2 subgroup domain-containing protein n=1 Tax=Agrocybe pediades TaxID=84607 RepID=A0A8H4VLA2_9AGAR|nr:hypothetical protein D9613_004322 [Agrocybe pediades]
MARIGALFFAFFAFLVSFVAAVPAAIENRDLIGDVVNLLGVGFVESINAYITIDSLTTNLISIDFDIKNLLLVELTITRVVSSAGVNGTEYAKFDHTFEKPVVVGPLKTVNSGNVPDVLLTQGAIASLDIIPLKKLDLLSTDVYVRAATIKGKLGIPISLKGLKQKDVPTEYTLQLF